MNANELADKLLENNAVSWGDCTYEQHDNDKYFKTEAATMLRQQQAEIEALKKEKWLTEIDAKQQALKKIIDWLILEHDTLACTSYPIRKAQEK
jgi:hypothetical protein